jgi:membrane protein
LGVGTIIFGTIFKILPDVSLSFRDVWIGALLTAVLFYIGKLSIGVYLGKSALTSSYGAAGSLVIILLWVFYSSYIIFFGAEFTRAYATREGRKIEPKAGMRFKGNPFI